jgi:glutamate dehydrogenase/leucine dehydrogenase
MVSAFADVLRTRQSAAVDMRLAAHMLAVSRVAEATTTRGIYP